ncbi:uncharacterized protein LOC115633383 [Scaptodrosophila lebanonensis]|uniref:Uncharacterized protein LOC115633383 n=1 Tax=Drosophila lebanonensis TaxID=7225 RepID=A0A6J2UHP3_DROLE|nr:uncharacterized protein LOC115633383 [Scaptodrosophila lebanonensis]
MNRYNLRNKPNKMSSSEDDILDATMRDNSNVKEDNEKPSTSKAVVQKRDEISDDLAAVIVSLKELTTMVKQGQQDIVNMNHRFTENRLEDKQKNLTPLSINQFNPECVNVGSNNANPNLSVSHTVTNTTAMPAVSTVKIYDLPMFSGSAEQWPLFIANFNDTTEEFNYTNRQNLIRLQKCLTGEAKETVAAMLIYPDDVPTVIEELKFRFGRPEILVRSQIAMIREFPKISINKLDQVIVLSTKVRGVVAFLSSANCTKHLENPILLDELISKLPMDAQIDWIRHADSLSVNPSVAEFSTWLSSFARIISRLPIAENAIKQKNVKTILHTNYIEKKCLLCNENHTLSDCKSWCDDTDITARWDIAKANHLCFSCLSKGHSMRDCDSKMKCDIGGCTRVHHKTLHSALVKSQPTFNKTSSPVTEKTTPMFTCSTTSGLLSQYFKIIPVVLYGPNGRYETFAMFDEGSAVTLLEENMAKTLGLTGQRQALNLQWYDQNIITEMSVKTSFEIADSKDKVRYTIKGAQTVHKLNLPRQSFQRHQYKHLRNLPIVDYKDAKPSLLIGLDNAHLGLSRTCIVNGATQPIGLYTKLGWLAYGPTNHKTDTSFVMHIKTDSLHELVKQYFSTEHFGTNDLQLLESKDNIRAREILCDTTIQVDNRFQIGLLWKENVQLPNSYKMAERRLLGIEKKMQRDEIYAEKYRNEMNKYLEKGYARKLMPEEIENESKRVWYLPHFSVQTVHKPEKLRIVFDAAATVDGVSLNTSLLKGPEVTNPLIAILLQFRNGAIGVAADIKEMFSQIRIQPEDQQAQRFLWRDGLTSQPIQHYAMTSLIFGAVCSPYCAEYIKNKNAEIYQEQKPEAVAAILERHYVDDLVISFDQEEAAIRICHDIVEVHRRGGFELRNFISNSTLLQEVLNKTPIETSVVNVEGKGADDKILGMYWNTTTDSFEFKTKFHRIAAEVMQGRRIPTKRELLGIVMAVYDPFGLIADFCIFAKILTQKTWSRRIQWDEVLPGELQDEWGHWWTALQNMQEFRKPRCYSPNLSRSNYIELHIFVDASQSAFAAAAYLRIVYGSQTDVAFVIGKTRLAPTKLLSIPRLELQAAVLGVRLNKLVVKHQQFKLHKTVFWSDSKTVLQWLHSKDRKFKPYVAHRVTEILSISHADQWRWVPSAENPADTATRQVAVPKINHNSMWLTGPEFLKKSSNQWPKTISEPQSGILEEEIETKTVLSCQVSEPIVKFIKFSSLSRLIRVFAWVLRAKHNLVYRTSMKKSERIPPLSSTELVDAENMLCKIVQQEVYSDEVSTLRQKQLLPKTSSIYRLSPYLEEDSLLRLSGRIDEAYYLPFGARRPIILPRSHLFSSLIMQHFHNKYHHQNIAVIINECRQKYWIPDARGLLKRVQKTCNRCIIDRSQPRQPLMGQHPIDRLTPYVRPFSYCGVDLFGPINVTIGRRCEKRWVTIFTCLTIRATHLEMVENLSTDAFIISLRNFINRRGVPVVFRSDNGTNFVGAQKELTATDRLLNIETLIDETSAKRIKWIFNSPANPSAGGCWERLIRIVKRLLGKTLKDVAPRVETLRSALIEVENILNSRPLTDLPVDHEDDEPLTPNHFLLGCVNSTQTPYPPENITCLRKQWHIAQSIKDRLWKRWINEYLPQLVCRSKWHDNPEAIKVDDLVIIMDESTPREKWKRGRITKLYPAKDGQIRNVDIRTATSSLRRPVSKLIILKLNCESRSDSPGGGV